MIGLRHLLASLLSVAILATGIGAGMAQGTMAAQGQLCSVTGPTRVVLAHDGLPLFGGDGEPVTLHDAPCLDCLIVAFDLAPVTPVLAAPEVQGTALPLPSHSDWIAARRVPGGQARAPPRAA